MSVSCRGLTGKRCIQAFAHSRSRMPVQRTSRAHVPQHRTLQTLGEMRLGSRDGAVGPPRPLGWERSNRG